MFPDKFMRFNFEAEPKSSLYTCSTVIGLSLHVLHVFTNPVVRHDFGAPLKHKSGIDSWILLHLDERERCKLTLYPGWLQRVEVASVSVHHCTHVVWGLRATVLALRKGMHTGVVQRPTPVTYRYNICKLATTTQPWFLMSNHWLWCVCVCVYGCACVLVLQPYMQLIAELLSKLTP